MTTNPYGTDLSLESDPALVSIDQYPYFQAVGVDSDGARYQLTWWVINPFVGVPYMQGDWKNPSIVKL